uniref:Uncharacterized protein n=1 Tax=Arundo donax TaxID=35708 RepID=A0A0A9AVQ2_ARUDO
MPGCCGPWIRIDNITYFRFIYSHEGRLYMVRITCHVLCEVLMSRKGFIPSVLNANLIFLGSLEKSGYMASMFFIAEHQWGVEAFYRSCAFQNASTSVQLP